MSPPNWPTITVAVEFVAGNWTTLPNVVRKITVSRGRQYELATPQAGTLGLTIDCSDGNLDPTNTASLYYPNVRLNKRVRVMLTQGGTSKVIFTGYIERYPQRWTNAGNYQFTDLVAADSLATLGRVVLDPLAYSVIGATGSTGPAAWWALDDAAGSAVAGSRIGGLPLTQLATRAVGSTQSGPFLSMGASPSIASAGMESTTAAGFTPGPNSLTTSPADMTVLRSPANQRVIPGAGPWTVYCSWSSTAPNLSGVAPNGTRVLTLNAFDGSAYVAIGITGSDRVQAYVKDSLGVDIGNPGVTFAYAYPPDMPNRGSWNNGLPHYSAVSLSADQKTITYTVSDVGVVVYVTKNDGSNWDFSVITSFSVGGEFRPYRNGNFAYNAWTGTVNNVAIWNSEQISNGGIGEIAKAEMLGYSGDNTVKRFQRLMGMAGRYIPYGGSSTGNSAVQAPSLKGKTLTAALTDLANDEFGTLYMNGAGTVTFNNRASRINPSIAFALTDRGTDGVGVYRYIVLTTDYDAQYLLNDVTVSRKNGVTARTVDQSSIDGNGTYSTKISTNIIDDQQAIDRAAYTVGRYAQPLPRISSIQINPGTDPNLWPVALALDLNQAISLVRTPAQGVPFTRSYWVEQISYSIDASNATFTMSFQLSPADVNNYLVLDDPVLGKLDSGNKLAY